MNTSILRERAHSLCALIRASPRQLDGAAYPRQAGVKIDLAWRTFTATSRRTYSAPGQGQLGFKNDGVATNKRERVVGLNARTLGRARGKLRTQLRHRVRVYDGSRTTVWIASELATERS